MGACLWEVPKSWAPRVPKALSCSGRTLDGPHPKRPSAGKNSWGMRIVWGEIVLTVQALHL